MYSTTFFVFLLYIPKLNNQLLTCEKHIATIPLLDKCFIADEYVQAICEQLTSVNQSWFADNSRC